MSARRPALRIGCASAFYGDSQLAARQLVERGRLDYLVFDYLAEVTMAILSRAKAADTDAGYAEDFVDAAMRDVLADCARSGVKVVANAGGVNVPACMRALRALCDEQALDLRIGGVYGDELSGRLDALRDDGLLVEEPALPKRLASANAYLGALPIAEALAAGADVVVTGRVVDSAVVLGPLIYEHGWSERDYNRLAQGSLAGHVLECGAQCTGGNFTDWHRVPDFSAIGYPIAEVAADGGFVVEQAAGGGGLVTPETVAEQVLYEIGDPANYLLPDVACDFSEVRAEALDDGVRLSGARGRAPGPMYKVCAISVDGWRLSGAFGMTGIRAADKARCALDAWIARSRAAFRQRGLDDFRDVCLEIVGAEHAYGPRRRDTGTREVMARFGLHHDDVEALRFAAAELAYLATSGPPGMSGLGGGRAKPQPLMRAHAAFVHKSALAVRVQLDDALVAERPMANAEDSEPAAPARYPRSVAEADMAGAVREVPLERLACARSGDKGDTANIGLLARQARYLPALHRQVTAAAVADWFAHLVKGEVRRYDLPGLGAFNFVLTEALGGGGTASLRMDSQGKALAQMLLSMPVRTPASWLEQNA